MATGPQADWSAAAIRYPVTSQTANAQFWFDFFTERPGVLHQLLGDLYLITKAHQQADRRGGRRSRNVNGNLDELWGMLTPKFAMEPFGGAVQDLIGEGSLRAFAKRIPMSHVQLLRLISGERPVVRPQDPQGSMAQLESIARAGGVHPSYFLEWRELFVYNALHSMFERSPNLSVKVMRQLMGEINSAERPLNAAV